ncbi:ABC transporter permease [Bradyrhizobium erythrophlei]|uniref:Peptide/nickel transport system permease protein n=1 Tax=Bradyrhizobium erythrophlei TaxID=1437360 RepID=A0A1H4SGP4_9BRAD|nr:ABC transporter permease [Bradyrhizobium erythrophlei]SEC43319.1 peptide/nickel transport system permease protein [Bradyrhizobium erythrophlei]
MLGYLLRRILAAIPVMGVVALFVFLLLRLTPGDPAAILAGDNATPEQLDRIRTSLGLNEPIYIQFYTWVAKLLHGDLGVSLISNKPILEMIGPRLEPSISVALATIVLSILVAVPLGVIAAWKHGTWIDRCVMGLSVLGFSVPVFVIGYVLIQFFAIDLRWVPVQGFKSIMSACPAAPPKPLSVLEVATCMGDGFGPFFQRIILPTCTLSFIYVALIARMTRASMLDVLGEDYVRTARAKGIGETGVLLRHALRNAAVPVITVIGSGFALLISGVVVTESVFNLPGIGRLTVDAVLARDYPVIQAMILLTSGIYVAVNLLIDLAYTLLDPRIRY